MTRAAERHPWTGRPAVKQTHSSSSSDANRKALKKMSAIELACGLTPEQYEVFHAAERARVRARYGLAA